MTPHYDPWQNVPPGYYFDSEIAHERIEWIGEHCRRTDNGDTFELAGWQLVITALVFGWRNGNLPKNHYTKLYPRRYRKVYILIPRKNGKTEFMVVLVLAVVFCEPQYSGEVYFVAGTSKDQSDIAFGKCEKIIRSDPVLSFYASTEKHAGEIRIGDPKGGGITIKKLSSRGKSKHGLRPWIVGFDELHTVSDPELLRAMRTGSMTLEDPLFIYTTTWGLDEAGLLTEIDDQARNVREGKTPDPTFLPVIFEADESDDWKNPTTWQKANPMYGITLKSSNFEDAVREAATSQQKEFEFRTYNLNQKVASPDGWLADGVWEEGDTDFTLESFVQSSDGWADPENRTDVWIGLDIGKTFDFTAAVFAFAGTAADGREGKILFPKFWTPDHAITVRSEKAGIPLEMWAANGWLNTTKGFACDYEQVQSDIRQCVEDLNLRVRLLAVDPNFQSVPIIQSFIKHCGWPVLEREQSSSAMGAALLEVDRLITEKLLWHDSNPLMRWMVGNCSVKQYDNGFRKLVKRRYRTFDHIDGPVAAVMAVSATNTGGEIPTIFMMDEP